MSSSSPNDVAKMVGIYKKLFLALAIVTCLGITVAYLHLPLWSLFIIGFIILLIKSKVIIDAFKEFLTGRNSIIIVFVLTGIFFLSVLLLPLFNHSNMIVGTQDISKQYQIDNPPIDKAHSKEEGHHGN